jgi:hypothetical protein
MPNAPNLTAKPVALLRAAHQLMEGGTIFPDPLAGCARLTHARTYQGTCER